MRYALTIAYDGSDFHGWQEQAPRLAGDTKCPSSSTAPDELRTVQGVLRATLQQVLQQPITLVGASRTDTGVHALGQVAHFDADNVRIPLERMTLAINSHLPDDIDIRDVRIVSDHFDAIRHAVEKQYRYRIWNTSHRPLMIRKQVHHCWYTLNVDAMNDAAQRLIGEHDFAGFANADHDRLTTVRTIFDCRVLSIPDCRLPIKGDASQSEIGNPKSEINILVRGSGFLYNMVRIITGTLIEVGRGTMPPEHIDELLRHPNRQNAGPTAPPQGLYLEWIRHVPPPPTDPYARLLPIL